MDDGPDSVTGSDGGAAINGGSGTVEDPGPAGERDGRDASPPSGAPHAAPAPRPAAQFGGRVLRFITVGLPAGTPLAEAPKPPPELCRVNFDEPHVVTEIRLVPLGMKPMQNLAKEHEDWIGQTAPPTFDLTVFYLTAAPKPPPAGQPPPADGQPQPKQQRWESLNKKLLKYNEKNRVQSLYTWKFTGTGQPIVTRSLLFRGSFHNLSVCVLGKTFEEWKHEKQSQSTPTQPDSPVAPQAQAAVKEETATSTSATSPPSLPSASTSMPTTPPSLQSPPSAVSPAEPAPGQASPQSPRPKPSTDVHMSPAEEEGSPPSEDHRKRRMSEVSSSAGSPIVARRVGSRDVREGAPTLGWASLRNDAAQAAALLDPPAAVADHDGWDAALFAVSGFLESRPSFESSLEDRQAWGDSLASELENISRMLPGPESADIEKVSGLVGHALNTESGCMTKTLLDAGLDLLSRLMHLGGDVASRSVDALPALLALLRDPLTSLPLRLRCIEILHVLLAEPAACSYMASGAVPTSEDDDEADFETPIEVLLSTCTRTRMPQRYMSLVGECAGRVALHEALVKLRETAETEGRDEEEWEGGEEVITEAAECLMMAARAAACSEPDVVAPAFPFGLFRTANLTGSITRLLAAKRLRAQPSFGAVLVPLLARLVVASLAHRDGLSWLVTEHAASGCVASWWALLSDGASSFSGFPVQDELDADEVRRCPGIFTSLCLLKPLFLDRGQPVPGAEKARLALEALSVGDAGLRNHFLTYLETAQIPILAGYTLLAASACTVLSSGEVDAERTAKLLQELEDAAVFDVGREAVVHVLSRMPGALSAVIRLAGDEENPGTARVALELLKHFAGHPLGLPRLKDPELVGTVSTVVGTDGQLSPWLSVLDVLKAKGLSAVLDLFVRPAHPTATDLGDSQVVIKMTAALSVILQALVETPAEVLACRISAEEVAGLETRKGLLERILSMLSRAAEILVKVAEPVTSVRPPSGKANADKREIKLEDLRAERSRAGSPTPSVKEGKEEKAEKEDASAGKVTVLITTEMIQLRRQILDLLFVLLRLLRTVMLAAYDAGNKAAAVGPRPVIRQRELPFADGAERPAEAIAAAEEDRVHAMDEPRIPRTPLFGVLPTLLDVLSALNFVDIRGTDCAGGALLTPSADTYQSTGTIIDEYQSNKLGDFYVVAKSKQTIAALIAAMSGAVMFDADGDRLPLMLDAGTSLSVARRSSMLGAFDDGYGKQAVLLPRFMEPASQVFSTLLERFAWKEPGNAWVAAQLLNEALPAPLPVYVDVDAGGIRMLLSKQFDEDNVEDMELGTDLDGASVGTPHLRQYMAKALHANLPELLKLVTFGALSSTRQLHMAIRTLVCRAVDIDVDDLGVARAILGAVLDGLDKVIAGVRVKPKAEAPAATAPGGANGPVNGTDAMDVDGEQLLSPVTADQPMEDQGKGSARIKAAAEASRWFSVLCAIAYLPSGRALLLCSTDREGKPCEKLASRVLSLVAALIEVLGSSSVATDLALEVLQWIFTGRGAMAADEDRMEDDGPRDDPIAGSFYWDPPDAADVAAVVAFALDLFRTTKDERLRSQLLLLVNTVAESAVGARAILASPDLRRSMRELLDAVLDLLNIRTAGGMPQLGPHELDVAISAMSLLKVLTESPAASSRGSAAHFLVDGTGIPEHEERMLRLGIVVQQAQELMETNGQRAMRLAEKGGSAFEDEGAGMLDPGLCASLAELTRFLVSAMSTTRSLTGEELLNAGARREVDLDADAVMENGDAQGASRRRTFSEMMWSRPSIVPSAERSELYMADLEDESAALLFEAGGEEVDLEAMAKEVLPDLSLRKKLRYNNEISLADITRSKFQRSSGQKNEKKQQQRQSKQPYRKYNNQDFRSNHPGRKANTSRAPSVHVDDFVKGGAGPGGGQGRGTPGAKQNQGGGGRQQQQQQQQAGNQGNRRQSGGHGQGGGQQRGNPSPSGRQGGGQGGQRANQGGQNRGAGVGAAGNAGNPNQMPVRGDRARAGGGQPQAPPPQQQWSAYSPLPAPPPQGVVPQRVISLADVRASGGYPPQYAGYAGGPAVPPRAVPAPYGAPVPPPGYDRGYAAAQFAQLGPRYYEQQQRQPPPPPPPAQGGRNQRR
ncbi:hypothetical protein DFJ74DRAFT_515227 [Hyaloraphidium curvatum]|nr:hypothetical protein DFJ74DRAFT_515227 [Hyaloraphidium curvatum]